MTPKFVGKAKFTSEPAAAFDPTLEGYSDPTPADIAAEKARQAGPALLAALQGLVAAVVDADGMAVLLALSQAQMAIEEATK